MLAQTPGGQQVKSSYLTHGCSISQGQQPVCAVQTDTVHTHGLLVLLTVQLQRLQVQVAAVLAATLQFRPRVFGLQVGLTGVAERAVGDNLPFLKVLPAQGTPLVVLHTAHLTLPTEAVGAGQQHGVPEDALTHGAGEVLLEGLALLRHVLIRTVGHGSTGPLHFTFVSGKTHELRRRRTTLALCDMSSLHQCTYAYRRRRNNISDGLREEKTPQTATTQRGKLVSEPH